MGMAPDGREAVVPDGPARPSRGEGAPAATGRAAPAAGGADQDALVRQAELLIAHVLRGGVVLSAAIILVGVILYLVGTPTSGDLGSRAVPSSVGAVLTGVAHLDPRAIIALGLLVLLATPVARVAVSIVTFGLERDWRYVAITGLVLLILIASFVLGKGGA